MTNPALALTKPYPFTRLRSLFAGVEPAPGLKPISLGIGEPQHPTPECILEAFRANLGGLAKYPTTGGTAALKEAIARWCALRYGVELNPATQVLPVLGSREALFAFVQAHIDASREAAVIMPSPFYQIYEGAALMAGARPVYLPIVRETGFRMPFELLDEKTLAAAQAVFVCSPSNPTGAVMDLEEWKRLFALSDRYGFVILCDECYSEIYLEEGKAPLGGLAAARLLGRDDFKNLVIFQSLSKRSNAPGMRSGFVAGDAALLKPFLLYRTYHGSAMSLTVQAASVAAWSDEAHVVENRRLYKMKFDAAQPVIDAVIPAPVPQASFYLWGQVPGGDDEAFARGLYAAKGVTVLPGSYLSRESFGVNAGRGFVRMALVATPDEALEAARRIADFVREGC
ncbi:MAG: succinyldiaminopimelate transaminase [Duodenibacillus sp.]|nr:succinyldiaminopimelate transaminase [Duodenibacillus sp.]